MTTQKVYYFYIILIVILVAVLVCLLVLLVVFRKFFDAYCCTGTTISSTDARRRGGTSGGRLNNAYEDYSEAFSSRPRVLAEPQPFNSMEQTECPPSYEEAVKQELFRFPRLNPPSKTSEKPDNIESAEIAPVTSDSTRSSPAVAIPSTSQGITHCSRTRPSASVINTTPDSTRSSPAMAIPSTSQGITHCSRTRSSASVINTPQLKTIDEEEWENVEAWPITVVIDCVGVQAARLVENCDRSVSLDSGIELESHSMC